MASRSWQVLDDLNTFLRHIPASYPPFRRIEVVGAVAEVFGEAERETFVADQHIAAFRAVGQGEGLFLQEADGLFPIQFDGGEGIRA